MHKMPSYRISGDASRTYGYIVAYESKVEAAGAHVASRHIAVGLAGYAPFMPNHGHPALMPDVCGPDGPARCACLQQDRLR